MSQATALRPNRQRTSGVFHVSVPLVAGGLPAAMALHAAGERSRERSGINGGDPVRGGGRSSVRTGLEREHRRGTRRLQVGAVTPRQASSNYFLILNVD